MLKRYSLILITSLFIFSCGTYSNRVSPVPLPASKEDHVNVDGVLLLARAYVDADIAEKAFGFDIREAGLLPIKVIIDNQSNNSVRLIGKQSFLLDKQGQAWPLLSANQANERIGDQIQVVDSIIDTSTSTLLMGAAGAITGLALGVLTGNNLGTSVMKGAVLGGSVGAIYGATSSHSEAGDKIAYDVTQKAFDNHAIPTKALAHGYLFFPGLDEAESAQILRLSLIIKGKQKIVNISLSPAQ
jgi:hypothetical protein